MSIFTPDDYKRDSERARKSDRVRKPHWEVKHRNASHFKKKLFHCPRLCQQKDNGNKGKKTFDGIKCLACGFKKEIPSKD